jgi:hypothetical protein
MKGLYIQQDIAQRSDDVDISIHSIPVVVSVCLENRTKQDNEKFFREKCHGHVVGIASSTMTTRKPNIHP